MSSVNSPAGFEAFGTQARHGKTRAEPQWGALRFSKGPFWPI